MAHPYGSGPLGEPRVIGPYLRCGHVDQSGTFGRQMETGRINGIGHWALERLRVPRSLLLTYCSVYFLWGLGMNAVGTEMEIARFSFWWQVITCYLFYMVPISLLLRGYPWHLQYAYGLIAMGFLEFLGYALETSHAYPGNLLEVLFGIRNFALVMSLFFASYFPLGNWAVGGIHSRLFGNKV